MAKIAEQQPVTGPSRILGIESSCDETAAAVLEDGRVLSNVVAGQEVHAAWGGVVPELASRAHQEHIVPVVEAALREAGLAPDALTAVAFTQGPGLIGALHVGSAYAKSFAQALGLPLLAVDHMRAHVLAHFIRDDQPRPVPEFPFLNLTVSGGHTLIVLVRSALDMVAIGSTLDDAAGEAFDKGAKLLGLPYPGGPQVDALAAQGDPGRFRLPRPAVPDLDLSFSGTKSAFRNLLLPLRDGDGQLPPALVPDLCATLQQAILDQLFAKLTLAVERTGITRIGIAGGVSANRGLRGRLMELADRHGWTVHMPPFAYCTDNAAMVAMAGDLLLRAGRTAGLEVVPLARIPQR
ncbi:MAG: tRNA (adenosine(37)-N6)-threonylcarbamoyltransferase complex transferase subunit TsaD [Flavobacteriales bacterium]|jgi:N6-L-threonylcarbamoyladenine synthase|nr:tRNA (adenosine(37)-N6)-threonylcarbamoyltransferase complex transferase subunit TsaD [Flavobacteriales bacterium]MBK7941123.1 tRNA (adenosine(37)-N6)-threonylcarbamoyltransferase complex transferase subunit TsaD [Flavobacteriales bacterium]MBK8948797.1 tRNA (adenosine(37)-N6)-threonylcarbamoyltransferase complex transferase subunit TsaD [Flavobacteriales bacterium]